jgi:RNA polymerase sigma factor (TIGR02999 family)
MERLFPLVYDELRLIAARRLRGERDGHMLCATSLVHEAWLELKKFNRIQWRNRSHVLAHGAQAMRRILIDDAVARRRRKRGGGQALEPLADDTAIAVAHGPSAELMALDQALERLSKLNARQAQIIECRFYQDMSIDETAEALGVSPATVKREWAIARAWLNHALKS